MSLTISVFSDVICPWCFLGKRRLEHALDGLGLRDTTTVTWLPFELNPDMPPEGVARAVYRDRKFGLARSAQLDAQMTEYGQAEGIAFAFERMRRTPNTRDAHRLIAAGQEAGRGEALVEGLFRAYFEQGEDIGDRAVLLRLARASGLAPNAANAALARTDLSDRIVGLEAQAARMAIGGVPFFIVDEGRAVSGAQTREHWIDLIRRRQADRDAVEAPQRD
ncbi:DsbA family oxidoreductase [Methylobacterium sp. J-068]|uniref:DsbA family oxidoreductase n=1 Tax=Methylobacterium sp. J-068 TaxID=2836649 RepID=UPI001FB9E104|nr:DsbA family oxidoreductase [Methylobacterium sp. J-068]MCJ2034951.1 DsbA family oxidoreductase [Methylobacterium sp. J-068]